MGKNKKGKAGVNKAEKNAGGEDSEPLVSRDEENDSQTEITNPDEVSTVEAQPATTETVESTEPVQEESAVVKEEEVQPVIVETTDVTAEEAAPESASAAESSETQAPAAAPAPEAVVDQKQQPEPVTEEQPKEEQPKEAEPAKEEHHERTYAEVVASNLPEERDSVNEDHPLMGDSKTATTTAKPVQPTPEFDETSELTVEPVTSAETTTSAPVAVAKDAPNESPKEESSFFTCLSSFKFW